MFFEGADTRAQHPHDAYNLLQRTGEKSYFLAPHYPLNPRILKVGLSWNFFD